MLLVLGRRETGDRKKWLRMIRECLYDNDLKD